MPTSRSGRLRTRTDQAANAIRFRLRNLPVHPARDRSLDLILTADNCRWGTVVGIAGAAGGHRVVCAEHPDSIRRRQGAGALKDEGGECQQGQPADADAVWFQVVPGFVIDGGSETSAQIHPFAGTG